MKALEEGFNSEYHDDAPAREEVDALDGIAVLEFGAPWCGHCLAARDAIHAAIDEIPGLRHIKVYDGKGKVLGRSYKVKLWPTLILLRNGEEVERLVRPVRVDDILPALARLLQD